MAVLWIGLTPAGVPGKLWGIGYSVCHQIESHSYMFNGMQLPLCSRCTGLFLGALSTIVILSTQKRRGGFPRIPFRWILLAFFLAYLVDGINSTLSLFAGSYSLYEPTNLVRLISGMLMGITLGVLLLSLWNQILWKEPDASPLLNSFRLLGACTAVGGLIVLLVVSGLPFLYYPLAVLSTGSVVLMLAMVYTLLWTLVLKRENSLGRWHERAWIFLLGGLSAMIQIALMDALRFGLTHSWAGFAI